MIVDQLSGAGKIAIAACFVLGLFLLCSGAWALARKGPVPRTKRRGAMAKAAVGSILLGLPAVMTAMKAGEAARIRMNNVGF